MKKIFTKTFFRFFIAFIAILAISCALLVLTPQLAGGKSSAATFLWWF